MAHLALILICTHAGRAGAAAGARSSAIFRTAGTLAFLTSAR
jgi:hypothetical protein